HDYSYLSQSLSHLFHGEEIKQKIPTNDKKDYSIDNDGIYSVEFYTRRWNNNYIYIN
ncbi:unnamed protein product, partial [Rotaria sp. Silwood2]